MSDTRWERVKDLFLDAADLPRAERSAWLDAHCDAELRPDVDRLLAGEQQAVTGGSALDTGPPPELLASAVAARLPGVEIGGFRIHGVLGSGGMGTVFEAEQLQPRRHVALKVLRPGLHTDAARRRFEYEATILARLRHPGIAQVHAAGSHHDADTGLEVPWIAMELIEGGVPIDRYVVEHGLDLEATLQLFCRACDAVAHGHQKGVLHRDLKPANLLVDTAGQPKIIDFGIGRALDEGGNPTLTLAGELLGTPRYMSLEQLRGDHDAVDVRADVHALGVILHELLTGRPPLDLDDVPLTRMVEAVHEARALPPSRVGPRAGLAPLTVELDWIVGKATALERERRYASVAELADDVRHFLAHEPLEAGPPSLVYRVRKSLRRHRLAVAATAFVCLGLLGVAVGHRVAVAAERATLAGHAVEGARGRIERYRSLLTELRDLETRVRELQRNAESRHLPPTDRVELDSGEARVEASRQERDRLFLEALEQLETARRLDPDRADVEPLRADLYLTRWRDAMRRTESEDPGEAARARALANAYRERILASPAGARHADELAGTTRLEITTDPVGAEIHLFRYVELSGLVEGGEPRLVPVPLRGMPERAPLAAGELALRVVQPSGQLAEGDLVVGLLGHPIRDAVFVLDERQRPYRLLSADDEPVTSLHDMPPEWLRGDATVEFLIDDGNERKIVRGQGLLPMGLRLIRPTTLARRGGIPARVWCDGGTRDLDELEGVEVRPTATPLLLGEASRVGTTPLASFDLARGAYLVVTRHPTHRMRRMMLDVVPGDGPSLTLDLPPDVPPGFVPAAPNRNRKPPGYTLMQEREVSSAEYLEFLDDPATRAAMASAPRTIRIPRETLGSRTRVFWRLDPATDRHVLPEGWRPDWPVLGISHDDAMAYAAWRSARDPDWNFRLPTRAEWNGAASSSGRYVFGHRFRAHWCNSCYSRREIAMEPSFSYPVDESPAGVYDLTGSLFEWLDDEYWDQQKPLAGGSWMLADPKRFRIGSWGGGLPDSAHGMYGVRLVAEPGSGVEERDR